MNNNFNKGNFMLWVKLAQFKTVHFTGKDRSFFGRRERRLHDMSYDKYLKRERSNWNNKSYRFHITDKFKEEFKAKFKNISKKLRPDFTEEYRQKMYDSFDFT